MFHAETSRAILAAHEPPAAQSWGTGRTPFLLVCDHAGRRLPQSLGSLGLSVDALESHIAWDIGAAEVARGLAVALDGCLVEQTYSRLAIDCNRPLGAADSIATASA